MMRWVIKKNHVTAEMVREYMDKESMSMSIAKKILVDEQMSLQYWDSEVFDGAAGEWGSWIDVPHITEYRG